MYMPNQIKVSPFRLPNVLPEKQLASCIRIINLQRQELIPLRKNYAFCRMQNANFEDLLRHWREKYEKTNEELGRLKKENSKLREERKKLRIEIEKLTKTNNRYQVALFDHGNFKHGGENLDKKEKGGQIGHPDTNRESYENYEFFRKKRLFAKFCGKCNSPLKRVNAIKQKVLLDILIKPELVKLIIESERQWCIKCKKEVRASDPQTLPFTEYGINTFMIIMILRFKGHLSMYCITQVLWLGFGLKLSKSDVSNLIKQASKYLGCKYEELIKQIRTDNVIYADETGWSVKGQKAWLWIMANEKTTVYFASESRGKGIAEKMYGDSNAYSMTDGYVSYKNTIPKDKHLFCWSHILRFSFEETVSDEKTSEACFLRDEMVRIYHIKKNNPEYSKEKLEEVLREEFEKLLKLKSNQESFIKIQNRVREQKEGLILALLLTKDGTNNLSERELRPMVLSRHVSYGSDTYKGMETSAILGSIIQTISKKDDLLTELNLSLQIGIHQKYPQYVHLVYSDT